ncbi:aminoacyl-tRNA hydrolase [Chamaesiphon sp. VAR_69_metabat_338]|uniref:aminoacyl-tRNA hydrolase n=1 Tax=Chamaesiphon sp. VAR_69_metabat_338 TaxID=2964704 RepID=UPI00286DF550|nr:aminoacyl-tRNA hydrolase [Chamaesiphon sp. VAR_69_metabat_338]
MSDELVIPQLIVGLGNPGTKYDRTRHNVGFDLVDILAKRWQISLSDSPGERLRQRKQFQGIYGEGFGSHNAKIRLLKPQTFMNLSGQSVRATIDWFKLSPASVLVVYDDLDLPLGKIRLRLSGSAGGHNGMKSIISHLGTQDFPRVRIGIGKSAGEKDTISHVLGKFSVVEIPIVNEVIQLVNDSIEMSLKKGVEQAMSLYNSRSIPVPEIVE